MDVNGIVIAASEVIRFEGGCGIMLTVCNIRMNFTFHILAKDTMAILWKKIFVNYSYSFSNLKIGAVEWLSGTKVIVLVTTLKSEYYGIMDHEQHKFTISNYLMDKISIPDIIIDSEIYYFSKLISYQGIITKVENSSLGIYELDNKIHLYCIFNSFRTSLPVLKENSEVFISNVHFLRNFKAKKIIVCCGLSSVRNIGSEVETLNYSLAVNLSHYPLSIFDVIWLEELFMKLNTKFYPAVISNDIVFHWENEMLNNILECFSYSSSEDFKKQSIGDEYCSNPHSCGVFCDDILPTGAEILLISEILDRASRKISWFENSDNWKTCSIENEAKYILIGMLYLSKDGCWYIMDKSYNIPIVFTQNCNQCKFLKSMFCSFENLNVGYLIALQHFSIVYEKIKFHLNVYNFYRYFKTSCCYIFYIGTFCRQQDNLFNFISAQKSFPLCIKKPDSIEEITQSLKRTYLGKQDIWISKKENFYLSPHTEDLQNNSISQYVLVLNKIWAIVNHAFVCYQTIVLLLPIEEICEEYLDKSKNLFGDSYNFYETDDDYDFAELVNQMDSLYLEEKPRLAHLHFESARQCALMLPGHIYAINFSTELSKDIHLSGISDKTDIKPVLIKIKPHTKILHHAECLGNHYPIDYGIDVYNSIEKIISERKVQENGLIKAVLMNKLYEDSYSSSCSQSEVDTNKTFCIILKDCNSEDTIKVYLPYCPKNMYGFLPGIHVQMWGFVCMCSRRGYLYLKPLSSFGIQIMNSDAFHVDNSILETDDLPTELKISSLRKISVNVPFKCICFIIRIVSVKSHLTCNSCGKDFMEKCSCLCTYDIKIKMSFIVDDGTDQLLAYCSDETARKILMLNVNEWKRLTSYVMKTRTNLNFYYKNVEDDFTSLSLMDKVFSLYCCNKSICRQICMKCKKKSDGLKYEQSSLWCYDILQTHKTDLISELIIKVKKICS